MSLRLKLGIATKQLSIETLEILCTAKTRHCDTDGFRKLMLVVETLEFLYSANTRCGKADDVATDYFRRLVLVQRLLRFVLERKSRH